MLSAGEHRIAINGVEHWLHVAGDGPPIVVVHGGPGANAHVSEVTVGPLLARFATTVHFDQRGCGRSGAADSVSLAELVADLDGVRAALGLPTITVLGQSFGGRIAAAYAIAHPDRVTGLVLHAPPITNPLRPNAWALRPAMIDPLLGAEARAAMRAELTGDQAARFAAAHRALDRDPAARARFFCHDPAKAPDLLRILDACEELGTNERMGPALGPTGADDLSDALAEVDVPTLVMVGLADHNIGVDACRDLAGRLPRGELHLFTRSAHFPEHEQPDDYAEAVREFVSRDHAVPAARPR